MKVLKFLMNLKRSLHFKHFFCFSFLSKIVIYYFMFYMTAQHNTWPLRALIYFCFQQWQLWRIQSQLEIEKASPKQLKQEFRLNSICHNSKEIRCLTIWHGKETVDEYQFCWLFVYLANDFVPLPGGFFLCVISWDPSQTWPTFTSLLILKSFKQKV